MKLIDGKELARNLRGEIAVGVAALKSEKGGYRQGKGMHRGRNALARNSTSRRDDRG